MSGNAWIACLSICGSFFRLFSMVSELVWLPSEFLLSLIK